MAQKKNVEIKVGDHVELRSTAEVDPDPFLTSLFPGTHPTRHGHVYLVEGVRRYQEAEEQLLLSSLSGYDRFWLNKKKCIKVTLR